MPGIVLHDPKYPHNVGQALRAASCFGIDTLWVVGDRVPLEGQGKDYRLPREERMRGIYDVEVRKTTKPFDENPHLTPVAVELVPGAEMLPYFQHPENALYVFGPEDGSLPSVVLRHCHSFVQLPMLHCANLASAVYVTLYDRHCKQVLAGTKAPLGLARG